MVFQNEGIKQLHRAGIRGESSETPSYLSFAGSDNTFTGNETGLNNEFVRKGVTWTQTGIQSKYLIQLSSTEANGSNIQSIGLFTGSEIGSNILYTSNTSFIGPKTSSFNVQIEGEVIIRRPSI